MDHQVRSKDKKGLPSKSKHTKNKYHNDNHGSFNYTQYNMKQRGPYQKEIYHYQYSHEGHGSSPYYNQHNKQSSYPCWSVFNGNGSNNKTNNTSQFSGKYEGHQFNYVKSAQYVYNQSSQLDRSSRSTNASSNSDNDGSDAFNELTGFKIVQNGKVIYHEDDETPFGNDPVVMDQRLKGRFASSELTIGPVSSKISMPEFIDIEQIC